MIKKYKTNSQFIYINSEGSSFFYKTQLKLKKKELLTDFSSNFIWKKNFNTLEKKKQFDKFKSKYDLK